MYFGGKHFVAPEIGEVLARAREGRDNYLEPFVGGLSIAMQVRPAWFTRRVLADKSLDLILLYRAIQQGWSPPTRVTEEARAVAEEGVARDPGEVAAVLGVARVGGEPAPREGAPEPDEPAEGARRRIAETAVVLVGAELVHADYRAHRPVNALVYCDPPYRGTMSYDSVGGFDSRVFWETVRGWSATNTVLVSEYEAPPDFERVWSRMATVHVKKGAPQRRESLWRYRG